MQFAVEARSAIRAEAVSSGWLPESHALGERTNQALADLGWIPPAGCKDGDPQRPENFHRTYERPIDYREVARLAVRTLRDVFQASFPGRLEYDAFAQEGGAILLPMLRLARRPPTPPPAPKPETLESMRAKVLEALREASGVPALEADADGDIRVPYGDARVFLRLYGDPPYAKLQAAVAGDVHKKEGLAERLNRLNGRVRFARFVEEGGWIFVAAEVFTRPFSVQHVVHACRILGELVEDMGEKLQGEFGGRPPLAAAATPALRN